MTTFQRGVKVFKVLRYLLDVVYLKIRDVLCIFDKVRHIIRECNFVINQHLIIERTVTKYSIDTIY